MNDLDLDLPEFTEAHLAEFQLEPAKVVAEDLHLGPAQVQPLNSDWYKKYSPQPPGPGIRSLDVVIALMTLGSLWLIVASWSWVLSR